jgi:hypothetical protein
MDDDNSSNPYGMSYPNKQIVGNEVIQFNPNSNTLFDDLDLDTYESNDDSRGSGAHECCIVLYII